MARERSAIATWLGLVALGGVLSLVAAGGLWLTMTHYDHDAAGFPPGWHCTTYGRGAAQICERRPAIGAGPAVGRR